MPIDLIATLSIDYTKSLLSVSCSKYTCDLFTAFKMDHLHKTPAIFHLTPVYSVRMMDTVGVTTEFSQIRGVHGHIIKSDVA